MENNEVFETLETATNETEEVVNEEEVMNEEVHTEPVEVDPEAAKAFGELIVIGTGFVVAGAIYGIVKVAKWTAKKVVNMARKHKTRKENEELIRNVLEADAEETPLDVEVPEFKSIDAD